MNLLKKYIPEWEIDCLLELLVLYICELTCSWVTRCEGVPYPYIYAAPLRSRFRKEPVVRVNVSILAIVGILLGIGIQNNSFCTKNFCLVCLVVKLNQNHQMQTHKHKFMFVFEKQILGHIKTYIL